MYRYMCSYIMLYTNYTMYIFYIPVLLMAYFNGNGSLCRAVVRAGASLGTCNKEGLTIFNAPVATKQLLFKLLGESFSLKNVLLENTMNGGGAEYP